MKKVFILFFGILICCSVEGLNAQQLGRAQRGQRGYTPAPRQITEKFIELKDPYEETNRILPKCVEAFKLDAFEQEILKSSLIHKFERLNRILEDKKINREERKKNLISIDKEFYREISTILTQDEVEEFKLIDFEETKEEKKLKKKKKKKKRKNRKK